MHHFMIYCFVCLTATISTPAAADCASEIDSLFHGGAWDPFVRPNRHETTVTFHPDGKETPYSNQRLDGPSSAIICYTYGCFMWVGKAEWYRPTFDGPWTRHRPAVPGDTNDTDEVEKYVRDTNNRLAASVSEPECLGATELDGKSALRYRFFSKPKPDENGKWSGGHYSVWVQLVPNNILRIEIANGISSDAPEPSKDVKITTFVYDDTIHIEAAE